MGAFSWIVMRGLISRFSRSPAAMPKVGLTSSSWKPGFVFEDDMLPLSSRLCHPGSSCKDTFHSWYQSFLTRPQRKRESLLLPACSISHCSRFILNNEKIQTPFLVGSLRRLISVLMLGRSFVTASKEQVLKPRGHRGWEEGP